MRKYALLAALCLSIFVTASCDPPGRPDLPEVPAAEVVDFKILYTQNCSGCHGAEGKYGPGRILNDALYLKLLPREELHKILVYGRSANGMPPWALAQGGPLNEKQIDALVNGIYATWSKPVNLHGTELPTYSAELSSGDVAHGKKLFVRNCYMCHGPGAKIGSVSTPAYLQLVSNQMLRTSIIIGRSDLGMPNYQNLNAGHALANQDVSDLVTYLASLRPASQVPENMHTNENEGAANGSATGSKGSGNGPGSPSQDQLQGVKHVNSSQSGGTIEQRKEQH